MATKSQWRAVIGNLARAAKACDAPGVTLVVKPDGSGMVYRLGDDGGDGLKWDSPTTAPQVVRGFGIPIDPDPAPEPTRPFADGDEGDRVFQAIGAILTEYAEHPSRNTPSVLFTHTHKLMDLVVSQSIRAQLRSAGPAPNPAPRLSEEGRAELLAQFTAAALTGFASCPEHYTRDEAARRAVETAQTALHAFEAAIRESAEKGRD